LTHWRSLQRCPQIPIAGSWREGRGRRDRKAGGEGRKTEKGEGRKRGEGSGRRREWRVIPPNENPGYGPGLLQK